MIYIFYYNISVPPVKKFRNQLAMILHSCFCMHTEEQAKKNNRTYRCPVQRCSDTKLLLNHIKICFLSDTDCRNASCKLSKRLISHIRDCKNLTCQLCGDIKQKNAKIIPLIPKYLMQPVRI